MHRFDLEARDARQEKLHASLERGGGDVPVAPAQDAAAPRRDHHRRPIDGSHLARRGVQEQDLVVEWLRQLRGLQPDAFADYLQHIRTRHAADRELLDELSKSVF